MRNLLIFGIIIAFIPGLSAHAQTFTATTTLRISVCGNAVVEPPLEVCDDGVNNSQYSTSTATRNCLADCSAFAPYCGDGILQQVYGEQCDDGNNSSGDGCSASCVIESTAPL